jgi:L-rhamnonate dehydratase
MLEPYHLAWFEEPVVGNDPELLAELARQTSIPIAAGQELGNLWAHRELVVRHAVDIVQPNPCHGGGYSEAAKIAVLAEAFNLPIAAGGGQPFHNLHLHAGVQNGGLVEYHWLSWKVGEQIFDHPPLPEGGSVSVPAGAGLGFEPRLDVLAEHRLMTGQL